jgi:hypothetical protein
VRPNGVIVTLKLDPILLNSCFHLEDVCDRPVSVQPQCYQGEQVKFATDYSKPITGSDLTTELHSEILSCQMVCVRTLGSPSIAASTKADTVIAENRSVTLEDLEASNELNADQKAQILKKPALQES